VLYNIGQEIERCYLRATEYREFAAKETVPDLKAAMLDLEQRWLNLAQSYEVTRTLSEAGQ
jgi:hypothetical protein